MFLFRYGAGNLIRSGRWWLSGMRHRMWPASDFMAESLKKLDFLVNVDLFMTETSALADIVLPACSSFERSELKVWVENHVMWTQPVIEPLGQSRSDAEIIFDLARRIAPEDSLFQKGYEANIDWLLEPTGLTVNELKKHPEGLTLNVKMPPFRKYEKNGFPTPSGKMEFSSTVLKKAGLNPLPFYQEPRLSRTVYTAGRGEVPSYPHHRRAPSHVPAFEDFSPGLDKRAATGCERRYQPPRRSSPGHWGRRLGLSLHPKRLHQSPRKPDRSGSAGSGQHIPRMAGGGCQSLDRAGLSGSYFRFSRIQSPSLRGEEMIGRACLRSSINIA